MSFFTTSAAGSKWESLSGVIPGSGSLDLETVDFGTFLRGAYEVSLYNDSEGKFCSFTLSVGRMGVSVEHSISGLLGDGLDVSTNALVSGTDLILRLTNAETFDVNIAAETLKIER